MVWLTRLHTRRRVMHNDGGGGVCQIVCKPEGKQNRVEQLLCSRRMMVVGKREWTKIRPLQ